ncbi:WD repeat-containing protein 76 [Xenopus laevis]|uniref:WD repeat-containing protein 76 n=2 Tax=Xenopus laevis TaxID=8355 RepID=WDR76_XENLA|nr:WD repeat-containing protein 76 [Xenopus laevis]Q4KLQ5.1 RecName: Full=WD repeat-containing protein 76 [Xenopus laevis]AAH99051.1 Wdr76 protein [Xenopus laevis]
MEEKKETAQMTQETTPKDSRVIEGVRRSSRRSHAEPHSPKKAYEVRDRRQKRSLERDQHEDGTPIKRARLPREQSSTRKHPIVLLSREIPEYHTETMPTPKKNYKLIPEQVTELSEYEIERLNNIKENAKFLQSLKLLETASSLRSPPKKQNQTRGIKREKQTKVERQPIIRRSMRLQRIDPSGAPLPNVIQPPEPLLEEHPVKPPGPLEMVPTNLKGDCISVEEFLKTWASTSKESLRSLKKQPSKDFKRYTACLQTMTLREETVAKVVQNRIFSVAIHPSESRTIVAAGDKWGQIGLWDLADLSGNDGVYVFEPHSRPISCMSFSPVNSAQLFSLSYDGTVRCGDVCRSVFDEVYRDEQDSFSSFDYLSADCSVLIVSHWDSYLSVVDCRTPGTSCEQRASLNMRSARTTSVHPVNRDLCVVAGAGDVCIFDVRQLKKKAQPVLSLTGHSKSVASAYFSPVTGNRILTTCADDYIRVYDSSSLCSEAPLLTAFRHNNNTGRWLTRFRAVWDPKQESCFVVGSMARPRQIEVYNESGKLEHSFWDSEHLGSVCSINAMHPTRNLLVGGNSSGRLHVFHD